MKITEIHTILRHSLSSLHDLKLKLRHRIEIYPREVALFIMKCFYSAEVEGHSLLMIAQNWLESWNERSTSAFYATNECVQGTTVCSALVVGEYELNLTVSTYIPLNRYAPRQVPHSYSTVRALYRTI